MLVLLPMQLGSTLPFHMASQGFTSATYGLVMAMNGLMIIVVQPLMISWTARHDAQRILISAALLYGGGLVAHGLAPIALRGGRDLVDGRDPRVTDALRGRGGDGTRERYQGMFVMTWGVGQMVGPKVGTYIWQDAGPTALWASCAGLAVLVALALWITAAPRRARMSA